jgi:pantoate--beta-alanine ligase
MIAIVEKTSDLAAILDRNRKKGNTIGFVPTMGALHKGHVSLVKKSVKENDMTIVSIFVNPTQFNNKKDLAKYPRTLEADISLLMPLNVDIVFNPSVHEIYPHGNAEGSDIDLGRLDTFMEGAFRPGHFKGVAQVVRRLLEIVAPDRLYMGQKDFQQFTIIQFMLRNLKIKATLVVCRIIRETNGLAMSSRNVRLSSETRAIAGNIYNTLKAIKKNIYVKSIKELEAYGMKRLSKAPFKPEYLTIVDGNLLTPLKNINDSDYVVACVAVWADGVRLIDNIILKKD